VVRARGLLVHLRRHPHHDRDAGHLQARLLLHRELVHLRRRRARRRGRHLRPAEAGGGPGGFRRAGRSDDRHLVPQRRFDRLGRSRYRGTGVVAHRRGDRVHHCTGADHHRCTWTVPALLTGARRLAVHGGRRLHPRSRPARHRNLHCRPRVHHIRAERSTGPVSNRRSGGVGR